MGPVFIASSALALALVASEGGRENEAFGLDPAAHARKVHPWVVRLSAAVDGLDEAVGVRNVSGVVAGLEDVWFWIGRLVADMMSALDAPSGEALLAEAAPVIQRAYGSIRSARELLASERFGLLGAARRRAAPLLGHIDVVQRDPENEAAWTAIDRELERHRVRHPLVTWILPRLNRALGLSLRPRDVPVYLVPKLTWGDIEQLAGFAPWTTRAFFLEGAIYAPKGRAWSSILHEVIHLAGLDYDLGLSAPVVEGLAEVVSTHVGLPGLERGLKVAYKPQVEYVKRLSRALGFRRPQHLARWLISLKLSGADVPAEVTAELVRHHPELSAQVVQRELAWSDAVTADQVPPYTGAWLWGGQRPQIA